MHQNQDCQIALKRNKQLYNFTTRHKQVESKGTESYSMETTNKKKACRTILTIDNADFKAKITKNNEGCFKWQKNTVYQECVTPKFIYVVFKHVKQN